MKYKISLLRANLAYVHYDVTPEPMPWEGVHALYQGEDKPLQLGGPFDVPPFVQEALRGVFKELHAVPDGPDRAAFVTGFAPRIVGEPAAPTADPELEEPDPSV